MCDEYEEERMWAFWRGLEIQEELKEREREPQEVGLPLMTSLPETQDARKARPRPLTR